MISEVITPAVDPQAEPGRPGGKNANKKTVIKKPNQPKKPERKYADMPKATHDYTSRKTQVQLSPRINTKNYQNAMQRA